MNSILARHAECIFWLARQVERSNSTARILDINETFSRNARGELRQARDTRGRIGHGTAGNNRAENAEGGEFRGGW